MNRAVRKPLLIWLAVMAICLVALTRIPLSTDMSAFLPRHPTAGQQVLVDQLHNGVVSRLLLGGIEGGSEATLATLSKAMAAKLRQDPAFASVDNGETAGFAADEAFLWEHRYLLSPNIVPEHFSITALHAALQNDLGLLTSGLSPLVKRTLTGDPTGETLVLAKEMMPAHRAATKQGVWFAEDKNRALLMLETKAAGFDIATQKQAVDAVRQAFEDAQAATPDASKARLILTGPAVFAVDSKARIEGEASRLGLLASVLVATLLLLAFRSPRLLVLAFLPVLSGVIAGMAAVGLGFGFIHGITLGFGVTLIGEAVDYAIYLFSQTRNGTVPEKLWPLLRLGMLISVCGFAAMLFSSFTGFAQLGLFTITGLVTALLVTRFVLPGLLPANFTLPAARFAVPQLIPPRLQLPAAFAVLTIALLALALHRGPWWENQLASLSPLPAEVQQQDQELRRELGAPAVRYLVVVKAPDTEKALALSEDISQRLSALVQQGALDGFDAPSLYLPSLATQRRRQAALPNPTTLEENLEAALADLPFKPGIFAPFLGAVAAQKTMAPILMSDLAGTALGLKLDALLLTGQNTTSAVLPLKGLQRPGDIATAIDEAGNTGALLVDLKQESDNLLSDYRREAIDLSLCGAFAIALLLTVSLRSIKRALIVLAPLAAAIICTLALILTTSHLLSIFNLFGLLLVAAIGSNYCLFFESPAIERGRSLTSLLLANFCTVIGFGVLALSTVPLLHGIGATVAIGAFLSLVFGMIMIKPVPA
jgi:predicted exporter